MPQLWEELVPCLRNRVGKLEGQILTPVDAVLNSYFGGYATSSDAALIAFLQQKGSRVSSASMDCIDDMNHIVDLCRQGLNLTSFGITELSCDT